MASEIEEVADFDDDDIDIEMDDLNEEGEGAEPQESVSEQSVIQPIVTEAQVDLEKHKSNTNEVQAPNLNGPSVQEFVEAASDSTHLTSELALTDSEIVSFIETEEESTQGALSTSERKEPAAPEMDLKTSSESENVQQSSAPVQVSSSVISTSSISSESLFRVPTLSFDGSSEGPFSHIPTPNLSSFSDLLQSDIMRTPTISASSSFSSSDSETQTNIYCLLISYNSTTYPVFSIYDSSIYAGVTFGPDDSVLFSDDKQLFNSPISKLMSKLQAHFSIDTDVVLHFPDLELKFITNLTFADRISPKELYSLTARLNKKKEGGAFLFKATLTSEAVSFSKKYRELLNLPYELVEGATSILSDSSDSVVKPRHPAFVASRFLERGGDSGYEGDRDAGVEEEDEDDLDDSGYAEDDEGEQPAEPAIAHPREDVDMNGVVEESRIEIDGNGLDSKHSTSTTEAIAALSNGKRARESEPDQGTSDEPPAKKAKVDVSSEATAEEEFVDI